MFRKLFLLAAFVLTAGIAAQAQNVQVHYDFGRAMYSEQNVGDEPRPLITTTVEMFRADKWGNTFFFVDMNSSSHWYPVCLLGISREFKLANLPSLLTSSMTEV